MNRYIVFALIGLLLAPALAVARSSTPSVSVSRQQQIVALQRQLRVLLAEYQRLLAQLRSRQNIPPSVALAPVAVIPSPAPQATITTYSAPLVSDSATQLESLVLQYSNDARQKNGLGSLANDPMLVALARGHSSDMLQNNYFNHSDLSGCNSTCRMNKSGYAWQKMGENIHEMSGYDLSLEGSAQKIVNDWLGSPEHRANLLNASYTNAGVGVAMEGDTIYTSMEYSLPQ